MTRTESANYTKEVINKIEELTSLISAAADNTDISMSDYIKIADRVKLLQITDFYC